MEPTLNSQNTPYKQSRRDWLRDTAIAATSAAVMPSLLIGCSDHRVNPGGGLGSSPPDDVLYPMAADNLTRMYHWHFTLYASSTEPYIQEVYKKVKAGEKPANWTEILVEVFTKLGLTVLEAVLEEIPVLGAAIGIAVEQLEKWAFSESEGKVDKTISEYETGLRRMYTKVRDYIAELADPKDNYQNLQEAFKKGDIEFNGKKYTLKDLALNPFPAESETVQFNALIKAATLRFQKSLWNAMFIKAADFHSYSDLISYDTIRCNNQSPTEYATKVFYANEKNAAYYLRGYYEKTLDRYHFNYWYFTFDGIALTEAAAEILFKDDARGNIVNPEGLFERDYVFKQFHRERQSFGIYHDLRTDDNHNCNDDYDFVHSTDNYEFTGGEFPILAKLK